MSLLHPNIKELKTRIPNSPLLRAGLRVQSRWNIGKSNGKNIKAELGYFFTGCTEHSVAYETLKENKRKSRGYARRVASLNYLRTSEKLPDDMEFAHFGETPHFV